MRLMADDGKICALFKKLPENFTLPMTKWLGELELAVKAGKFKIELEGEKKKGEDEGTSTSKSIFVDKNEDHKEQKAMVLSFGSVSFSPNEKLFPVQKQSNLFEMVGANKNIRLDYTFEESSSENTDLKSLNDCYLRCLNSNTDDVVCHSFAFCFEPEKSLAKCRLSSLYFEDSMGRADSFSALEDGEKSSTPSSGDSDSDYSQWLEAGSGCTTYNLMYKNYFKPVNDRIMPEQYSFITLSDHTLEECLAQCHFHVKSGTAAEDSMCRLVEFCMDKASVDENGIEMRSTCMMSNEQELKILPIKDAEPEKNCQLYDCE